MSPNMIGALVGFIVGLMGFIMIRMVASRVESQGIGKEPAKAAGILRMVALFDFIFFIVVGYFVGPMIVDGST
jgi:hypothetical protein